MSLSSAQSKLCCLGFEGGKINMDELRIRSVAFVCALLSTPAFAPLTTIGPGTPGVTESVMTLEPTSAAFFFKPQFFGEHVVTAKVADVFIE
jgi:hypothetical protein